MMNNIIIHKKEDFESMRKAGQLASDTLDYITSYVKAGISTSELDQKCHDYILKHKAKPATLNYRGYQKSTCISLNHIVCHGIPTDQTILKDGDIVNIDVTVILDGWHGDTSRMYYIGDKVPLKKQKLVEVTHQALELAISKVKPGVRFGLIGEVIYNLARKKKFSVVEDYCGHGIGRAFHSPPNVLHNSKANRGAIMEEGMFFTIEPMLNAGTKDVKVLSDNWSVITKDRQPSAQFEHTVGVTADGCEVFTRSAKNFIMPPYL